MLFNSLDFVLFFLVVYGLYLVLPHRWQNRMLLVASYFFYGCWDWRFLSLIWLSTLIDYWVGNRLHATESPRLRRAYLLVSICTNMAILGFFKYYNFFADNLYALLLGLGIHVEPWRLRIILPVGVSFYTFQALSYTVDIYRRTLKPAENLLNFALFVAYFPQLVAGPIERAAHLLPQVERPRVVTWKGIEEGGWLMLWGFFKKIVVADNLAGIADSLFSGRVELTAGSVLIGLYAFAFQIYGDFSGYSDIARGLAKWMGFDVMVNFRNPYVALNPSDFWRRWHISLSTWLRDYLYIPLGGNRKGLRRTYVNLAITMLLGGLWHGAAWTFVIWGAYHGLLLAVHRAFARDRAGEVFRPSLWGRVWRRFVMFHAVCFSWLLFRASSMTQVQDLLGAVMTRWTVDLESLSWAFLLVVLCIPVWIVQRLEETTGELNAPLKLSLVPKTALIFVCLFMMWCLGNTGGHAFIYFQF